MSVCICIRKALLHFIWQSKSFFRSLKLNFTLNYKTQHSLFWFHIFDWQWMCNVLRGSMISIDVVLNEAMHLTIPAYCGPLFALFFSVSKGSHEHFPYQPLNFSSCQQVVWHQPAPYHFIALFFMIICHFQRKTVYCFDSFFPFSFQNIVRWWSPMVPAPVQTHLQALAHPLLRAQAPVEAQSPVWAQAAAQVPALLPATVPLRVLHYVPIICTNYCKQCSGGTAFH